MSEMNIAHSAEHGTIDLHKAVAYLLALIPQEVLQGKRARIHRAFFELQQSYPTLLAGLAFSKHSSDPYSKILEEILFCLANARLLSNLNPTFNAMSMSAASKKQILDEFGADFEAINKTVNEAAESLGKKLAI
jgi:hypothetical protein